MDDRCSPEFRPLLEAFSLEDVERHEGSVYGLWPDLRLAYFNPGWVRFAEDNGGDPAIVSRAYLGTSVIDVTPEVLRPFYRLHFLSCLHETRKRRRPFQHRYECSSPGAFREFVMTLYPLREASGLLVVNSLVVEKPHDRPLAVADRREYADERGFVHQCTHCRRVRRMRDAERWDWVPEWVERFPLEVSHTLCPFCLKAYYIYSTAELPDTPIVESALR